MIIFSDKTSIYAVVRYPHPTPPEWNLSGFVRFRSRQITPENMNSQLQIAKKCEQISDTSKTFFKGLGNERGYHLSENRELFKNIISTPTPLTR